MTEEIVLVLKKPSAEMRERLTAFQQNFHSGTQEHPIVRHLRIWKNEVNFEVSTFDGKVHLNCIQAWELGRGMGSKGLDWLVDLTRKHRVGIRGDVQRLGTSGLSQAELRRWHKRHGFTVNQSGRIAFDPAVDQAKAAVSDSKRAGPRIGAAT